MKVTIEITKQGYTKTLTNENGQTWSQEWIRENGGYRTTDEAIDFDTLEIANELKEAIDQMNFELGDLSEALMTESVDLPYNHGEAITNDGHQLQRGDIFYSIATDGRKEFPIKHKYPQDWYWCGSETYINRENCQKDCEVINTSNKTD